MNQQNGVRTAVILWCAFMVVCTLVLVGMLLSWATDPDYFWAATIQLSLLAAFGIWYYLRLGLAAFRQSALLPRMARQRMVFWLLAGCMVVLLAFLPNPDRDAFATQRTIYGALIMLLIAGVHWVFYRKLKMEEAPN